MPILHHHPLSAASRYVRLVLAEFGEEPQLVEAEPWRRDEALLALNPAGTLPVLIDEDGSVVCGGSVAAEYLTETRGLRFGEDRLMPERPADRAEARRLVDWFAVKMNTEVTAYLVTEKVLKRRMPLSDGGGPPDSAAIRAARANIRYHMRYIGHLIGTRDWLAGRELSLADLAAAAEFSCVDYLGEVPWAEDEAAKGWYTRIKSRLSFRPILADRVRGNPPASHYGDLDF
jgi:glutathione S-transferase